MERDSNGVSAECQGFPYEIVVSSLIRDYLVNGIPEGMTFELVRREARVKAKNISAYIPPAWQKSCDIYRKIFLTGSLGL